MQLTFEDRRKIGNQVENAIESFFKQCGFHVFRVADVVKTGVDQSADHQIKEVWRSDAVKMSKAMVMLRYMPDFLVLAVANGVFQKALFIDIKAMFTPVYVDTFRKQLETKHHHSFPIETIGNVEREAFASYEAYQRAGAQVAVLAVCSYTRELILCEFVENITVLHTDTLDRNLKSAGSTTPRINVDFASMRPFGRFLSDTFDLHLAESDYHQLHSAIRKLLGFVACPEYLFTNTDRRSKIDSVVAHLSQVTGHQLDVRLI